MVLHPGPNHHPGAIAETDPDLAAVSTHSPPRVSDKRLQAKGEEVPRDGENSPVAYLTQVHLGSMLAEDVAQAASRRSAARGPSLRRPLLFSLADDRCRCPASA